MRLFALPLYIDLSQYQNIECIITDALQARGLTADEIIESKTLSLIFILDGYEDLGESKNLYISNQLSQWPHAKTIITCRSQYFIYQNSQSIFMPFHGEHALPHLLATLELQPVCQESIHDHIKRYALNNHITLSTKALDDIAQWLEKKQFIRHILLSPFFLKNVIHVISHGEQVTDLNHEIIKAFMLSWQQYHQEKNVPLISHEALPDMNYHAAVARELKTCQGKFPLIKLKPNLFTRQQVPQNTLFDLARKDVRLAFMHAPLHIHGQYLTFLDGDLLTYLSSYEAPFMTTALLPASTTSSTASGSIAATLSAPTALETDNLNLTSYTKQDDMIALLADSILVGDKNSALQRKRLFQFVIRSKNNPNLAIASANALSALVAAGESFSRMDLRHINAPNANLSHMVAQGTLFDHANLSGSRLVGPYLAGSQFSYAKLTDVVWGEMGLFFWTTGCILGLDFVDSDRKLMAWGDNNTIALYNTPFRHTDDDTMSETLSATPTTSYSHHTRRVLSALYSHDGKYIISTGRDKIIRLLNCVTGKQYSLVDLAKDDRIDLTYTTYFPVIFQPSMLDQVLTDTYHIIYAKENFMGSYRLYRLMISELMLDIENKFRLPEADKSTDLGISGMGHVEQLLYIKKGILAIVVNRRYDCAEIHVHHVADKKLIRELPGYRLCASSQYQQIAVASLDKNYNNIITLYTLDDFTPQQTFENTHATAQHAAGNTHMTINALQYITNRVHGILCSAGDDGCILFWDIHSTQQTPILRLHPHAMPVTSIAISNNGRMLASASGMINLIGHSTGERIIRTFDVDTLLSRPQLQLGHQGDSVGIIVAPTRQEIYSAGRDGYIHCWSSINGEHQQVAIAVHQYHPDQDQREIYGLYLLSEQKDYVDLVVLLSRRTLMLRVHRHVTSSKEIYFNEEHKLRSPTHDLAFNSSKNNYVRVHLNSGIAAYDMDGNLLFTYRHEQTVRAAFSDDQHYLLAILCGTDVILLHALTGQYLGSIDGKNMAFYDRDKSKSDAKTTGLGWIGFSTAAPEHLGFVYTYYKPDNTRRTKIIIWNIATQTCMMAIDELSSYINTCSFSPSGLYFLAGNDKGHVMLWGLHSGQRVALSHAYSHGKRIQSLHFISERQFVIQQGDGSVKAWHINIDTDGIFSMRLLWCTNKELTVNDAVFDNTQGLTSQDQWILQSHGATIPKLNQRAISLVTMGHFALEHNQIDMANDFFSRAIQFDNHCAAAYMGRGLCHQHARRIKEAEEDFTHSITFGAGVVRRKALYYRGLLYLQVYMTKNGADDLREASRMTDATSDDNDNQALTRLINKALHQAEERKRLDVLFRTCEKDSIYEFKLYFKPSDIHERNKEGLTPLHIATYCGSIGVVTILLDNGADPASIEYKCHNNTLMTAIGGKKNQLAICELLLAKNLAIIHAHKKDSGYTPLHFAVACKQHDIARMLLNKGANPNARILGKIPVPLTDAIKNQDVAMVQLLLDGGADYKIGSLMGTTPFDLACGEFAEYIDEPKKCEALRQICLLFINKATQDQRKLKKHSLESFYATQAKLGISANTVSSSHSMTATSTSSSSTPPLSIYPSTPTTISMKHNTALVAAPVTKSQTADDFSRNLFGIFSGPDPDQIALNKRLQSYKKSTESELPTVTVALRRAAAMNRSSDVSFFLDKNAEINAHDNNKDSGKTALHYAAERGHTTMVKLLLQKGANINTRDINPASGRTALHYAYVQGHLDTVRFLLSKGADPLLIDASGKIPEEYKKISFLPS